MNSQDVESEPFVDNQALKRSRNSRRRTRADVARLKPLEHRGKTQPAGARRRTIGDYP
jgi:hypothetical protein